jgi:tRNA(fMet)-specific endonuclease VapC
MGARYLLDRNTLIYIRRERPLGVRERFSRLQYGEAVISVITYGELVYGVSKSNQKETAIAALREMLEILPAASLPVTAGTLYGEIREELEAKGKPIGNNDLWIAAHAMAGSLILVTNNEREFRRVKGLKIQNWVE